jgi:ubiquinone/menaquinone biosynthesis C-methylase UbiE
MLDIAKAKVTMPAERFILSRQPVLPFESQSFDLVLSVYVVSCAPRTDFNSLIAELKRVCVSGGVVVLIEQVDNARSLTPETYKNAFRLEDGFNILVATPIRSGSSRYARLATRRWMPAVLHPALALIEMAQMSKARFKTTTRGYWDYLLIASKQ